MHILVAKVRRVASKQIKFEISVSITLMITCLHMYVHKFINKQIKSVIEKVFILLGLFEFLHLMQVFVVKKSIYYQYLPSISIKNV